ncbi:MAG TPA: hypothetical protein VFO39_03185 [Candidatus Sulfotelmatobacter sp.]|nr:hypothetical protein [Candidatus Sulfotelmatobacter sp.]
MKLQLGDSSFKPRSSDTVFCMLLDFHWIFAGGLGAVRLLVLEPISLHGLDKLYFARIQKKQVSSLAPAAHGAAMGGSE